MSECPSWHPYPKDYEAAQSWARYLLTQTDWVILDTETTGIDGEAEAVQISVISHRGEVLLNTLIRPTKPIPAEATAINGITDAMVATAPTFPEIAAELYRVCHQKMVVAYNAAFDNRILVQSANAYGMTPPVSNITHAWDCAMERYAAYYGDWSDYHESYRWQKLPRGPQHQAHEAAGDCLATLDLIKRMAGAVVPAIGEADP